MEIITTPQQLTDMVEKMKDVPAFAFDVETHSETGSALQTATNQVVWISFASEAGVYVIPMGHLNGDFRHWDKPLLAEGKRRKEEGKELREKDYSQDQSKWEPVFDFPPTQLRPATVFKAIEPLMFGNKLKIGHNIKFDICSIAKYYQKRVIAKPYFDTMVAAVTIDNRWRNPDPRTKKGGLKLKNLVEMFFGIEMEKETGKNIMAYSFAQVAEYSGRDSELTFKLYEKLAPRLEGNLSRVWKLEMDVLHAVADMELTGAFIDEPQLEIIAEQIEKDKTAAEAKVYKVAGKVFPINSIPEKQKLLFESQDGKKPRIQPKKGFMAGLTPKGREAERAGIELTSAHYSVSADALEFYRGRDELVDALLEYQDLNKLMTTYVTPYTGGEVKRVTAGKEKIIQKDSLLINGRVYAHFNQHGADTGRFSSSEPNLQNIPSSGEYGKLIRNLFRAPEGKKLVVADYSQIEPRIIASLSKDPVLVNNYLTGGDIYTTIGDTMGVDRKAGKVLVLAISYGVGPDKIAQSIGCSLTDAKKLLKDFEARFPSINTYKDSIIRLAKQKSPAPYVETLFGRRRYIPELRSTDRAELSRAERQAFNTVIQGTAADIMKLALARAHSCFTDEPDINLILTVHDELVTECPEHLVKDTVNAIRTSMEDIRLKGIVVPLIAEVNVVDKWGEAK